MLFCAFEPVKAIEHLNYASKINASRRSCLAILESCLPEISIRYSLL